MVPVQSRRPRILLLGDTRIVGHHGSSSVVRVILRELGLRGCDVTSSGAAGFDYRVSELSAFDGVLMNAEGALHGRNPNAVRIARMAIETRRAGVPCYILNAVVDECHEDVVSGLRLATKVYCREHRSLERATAYGAPAIQCPDLTFALDTPDDLIWSPGERLIVTDSTLASSNRALHRFARRSHGQFLPLRSRPDVSIFSSRKALIRIAKFQLRHVVGRLFPGSFAADRFGSAVPSTDAFLRSLTAGVQMVVAGRFHAVCLCMKLGVPFVAVRSNTHKVEGMLEDAGLAHKFIDLEALAENVDLPRLLQANDWTPEDNASCRAYVKDAQACIASCFDDIFEGAGRLQPDLV
jgi:hypothetical protein